MVNVTAEKGTILCVPKIKEEKVPILKRFFNDRFYTTLKAKNRIAGIFLLCFVVIWIEKPLMFGWKGRRGHAGSAAVIC